jgi:hypothetical protein
MRQPQRHTSPHGRSPQQQARPAKALPAPTADALKPAQDSEQMSAHPKESTTRTVDVTRNTYEIHAIITNYNSESAAA